MSLHYQIGELLVTSLIKTQHVVLHTLTNKLVCSHSPKPHQKQYYQRSEHKFTPNNFVLEQACFHVVNMLAPE